MERQVLQSVRLGKCRAVVIAAALALSSGCHMLPHSDFFAEKTDQGCSVLGATGVANWDKRVHFAPDTAHAGKPFAGLIGRIYLINEEEGLGLPAEGELVVDFYDHTPLKAGGEPVRLPGCEYSAEQFRQFRKKDGMWGWGWTIFLPWPSYSPEVKVVYLVAKFVPSNGEPEIHLPPTQMTIDHNAAAEGIPNLQSRARSDEGAE